MREFQPKMCLESFFCLGCSVGSTRAIMRYKFRVNDSDCDLACICGIVIACMCFRRQARQLAYAMLMGCMFAQQDLELRIEEQKRISGGVGGAGPARQVMGSPVVATVPYNGQPAQTVPYSPPYQQQPQQTFQPQQVRLCHRCASPALAVFQRTNSLCSCSLASLLCVFLAISSTRIRTAAAICCSAGSCFTPALRDSASDCGLSVLTRCVTLLRVPSPSATVRPAAAAVRIAASVRASTSVRTAASGELTRHACAALIRACFRCASLTLVPVCGCRFSVRASAPVRPATAVRSSAGLWTAAAAVPLNAAPRPRTHHRSPHQTLAHCLPLLHPAPSALLAFPFPTPFTLPRWVSSPWFGSARCGLVRCSSPTPS